MFIVKNIFYCKNFTADYLESRDRIKSMICIYDVFHQTDTLLNQEPVRAYLCDKITRLIKQIKLIQNSSLWTNVIVTRLFPVIVTKLFVQILYKKV